MFAQERLDLGAGRAAGQAAEARAFDRGGGRGITQRFDDVAGLHQAQREDAVEGDRGIGKRARVEGFIIAGKTGTSRTHKNGQLDAWFIAIAPADKPRLAVAVFCDQEGTGMHVAAPIAGAFLQEDGR